MTAGTRSVLLALVVAVVWLGAGRAVWRLSSSPAWDAMAAAQAGRGRPVHVDSLVQAALQPAPPLAVVRVDATLESPFIPAGARRGAPSHAPVSPARPREPLYLSGILLRTAKPQAILEDAQGTSRICGEGDSVLGQVVVRIERDQVTLRDKGGTYTLQVKE